MCIFVCVYVCVCVRERERGRERGPALAVLGLDNQHSLSRLVSEPAPNVSSFRIYILLYPILILLYPIFILRYPIFILLNRQRSMFILRYPRTSMRSDCLNLPRMPVPSECLFYFITYRFYFVSYLLYSIPESLCLFYFIPERLGVQNALHFFLSLSIQALTRPPSLT